MSDDLIIGGPEPVSVLVSSLVEQSLQFGLLSNEIIDLTARLKFTNSAIGPRILKTVDAPLSAITAEQLMFQASNLLDSIEQTCRTLERGTAKCAETYESAEQSLRANWQTLWSWFAHQLGAAWPILLLSGLPLLATVAAAAIVYSALPESARARVGENFKTFFKQHNSLFSDPKFVEAVRSSVMSSDDYMSGIAGVPLILNGALADEGIGVIGPDVAMALLAGAGLATGAIHETGVSVKPVQTGIKSTPVSGIEGRVSRIPDGATQVRIDRYVTPEGQESFEVYIAGTAELSTSNSNEPWDMTSNLVAMGGQQSASYRAVAAAMAQAGITSESKVTFTGYSQGGIIAADLASSGKYNTVGLLTIAAPAGQISVPHDVAYLAVEHTNDLVPALGGDFAHSEPLVVRRQIYDTEPPHGEFVLPAHQLSEYEKTAALVDDSMDPRVEEMIRRLDQPQIALVETTLYSASRN
ncbi:MAG: hypothetical protein KF844_00345 [Cryobacterium sp.]|nr:hypothetical protein [Cryobacterium sp.]